MLTRRAQTVTNPLSFSSLFRKTPTPTDSSQAVDAMSAEDKNPQGKVYGITDLMIPRVMTAAAAYAGLSLVDISFRAIQPLFFSTPIASGGLGLDPPTIGKVLAFFGILNGLLNVFFFRPFHDRLGTKYLFMTGVAAAVPVFAMFPLLSAIAKTQGLSISLWAGVAVQVVFSVLLNLSYGELTFRH